MRMQLDIEREFWKETNLSVSFHSIEIKKYKFWTLGKSGVKANLMTKEGLQWIDLMHRFWYAQVQITSSIFKKNRQKVEFFPRFLFTSIDSSPSTSLSVNSSDLNPTCFSSALSLYFEWIYRWHTTLCNCCVRIMSANLNSRLTWAL